VPLAKNAHESYHAFRIGCCAWGVQFHPEYHSAIMRSYIVEQSEELEATGWDVQFLLDNVRETPVAARILKRFGQLVAEQNGPKS
jgi:GMP synthase (glutamine-hydrolysing)